MKREIIWRGADLASALEVEVDENLEAGRVQFNSKDVKDGDLFIALGSGDKDGHKYVADAFSKGASAAIISKDVETNIPVNKLIRVQNTLESLRSLADYKRTKSKAKIIAITGSVGKTSTKEVMCLMLSKFGKCFAGRGNFNNYLGVPINLASMPDDIDFAVLELGMNAKGEIDALTKQVLPHFAVITTIAENHLEFFESVSEIAKAKCEILNGLDLNEGVAIIPRDVDTYNICVGAVDHLGLHNVRTIGKSNEASIRLASYEVMEEDSVRLGYNVGNDRVEFVMNFIPEHIAMNFTCCFAVADELDLDFSKVAGALSEYKLGVGRGRVINTIKDGKNFTVIADYYNSGPASLKASLQHVSLLNSNKIVLVVGDMLELGDDAKKLHAEITEYINNSGASHICLIGSLVKEMVNGLNPDIKCVSYDNTEAFLPDIDKIFKGGETVLIKGSLFMRLEKVAKQLGVEDDI